METDLKGLSVVLPIHNEEACVARTLRELAGVLRKHFAGSFEILAVDDGSTDGTPAILNELASKFRDEMRVIRLTPNSGQSAAFCAGFRRAKYDMTVTMDADGQNDPADIPALIAALQDCDACFGVRRRRIDSIAKRIGSRIGNAVRNILLKESFRDTGCSLKAFRTGLVRDLPAFSGMHRFLPAWCVMQGARICEMEVNHRSRLAGDSKYTNLGRLKTTVPDVLAVRWMQRRYRRFATSERGE